MAQYKNDIIKAIDVSELDFQDVKSVLTDWNLSTHPENREAALAILSTKPFLQFKYRNLDDAILLEHAGNAAEYLKKFHGSLRVPFGDVQRLVCGETDLAIGGGPDILRAVYSTYDENGKLRGTAGDGLFFFVKWDKNGKVFSESIHQYGSATTRPTSPHYDDQAHLFVKEKMKPTWRKKSEILKHLEAKYSPGKYLSED
ncbi:MAG: penicillin acylase family protein, partial [Candidatus Marinimicrobia bacterium]|nr:penicillin acylase family protein [Candidatus Neomarinimicrobiota bacterium]